MSKFFSSTICPYPVHTNRNHVLPIVTGETYFYRKRSGGVVRIRVTECETQLAIPRRQGVLMQRIAKFMRRFYQPQHEPEQVSS